MTTTESLAWAPADIAKSHWCGPRRSRIFVALRAANFLEAADALLYEFIAAQRALPRDVAYGAGQMLNSYMGTALEPRLRGLIDAVSTLAPPAHRQDLVKMTPHTQLVNSLQRRPWLPASPVKNVVRVGM